jgi:triacylglycerol lipase
MEARTMTVTAEVGERLRTAAKRKPLPPNTLDNVIPPDRDYAYFEASYTHPFRHASDGFEMINAWWLAEAAFLAYAEPQFAEPRFQSAGLPEVRFFSGESTQCYVAHNDDFVIVAFRGSESRKRESGRDIHYILADWLVDLNIDLVDSGQGGSVHQGFKEALDEVWNAQEQAGEHQGLESYLDEVSNEDGRRRSVWFTGHSLGAALATLAAARYGNVAGLYTFGSPRVGDRAFAAGFRVNTYRFVNVNNDDLVTKVPLAGLYRHVGTTKYIDHEGILRHSPSLWGRAKDGLREVLSNASNWGLRRWERELPENSLTDHAPIYYATHIWNNLCQGPSGSAQVARHRV